MGGLLIFARARRNSPHTPLPPRPRFGWRIFWRKILLAPRRAFSYPLLHSLLLAVVPLLYAHPLRLFLVLFLPALP